MYNVPAGQQGNPEAAFDLVAVWAEASPSPHDLHLPDEPLLAMVQLEAVADDLGGQGAVGGAEANLIQLMFQNSFSHIPAEIINWVLNYQREIARLHRSYGVSVVEEQLSLRRAIPVQGN